MSYVTGTFTVPCYLQANGCPPGSTFNYSSSKPDALPTQKPRQRRDGALLLHRSRRGGDHARPRLAVWARAARQWGRGDLGRRRGAGQRAQLRHLRHRLVGPVARRRPLRHQRTEGSEQLPAGRRPAAAGGPQHPVSRSPDADRGRFRLGPGVPERVEPIGDRHLAPVLRRQQPGRHHGRHDDGGRARPEPGGARRPRHGLRRAPAPAKQRLPRLRQLPVRQRAGRRLHGQLDPSADPRFDAAALGPRRGRRIRAEHDLESAARHAPSTRSCCTSPTTTTR